MLVILTEALTSRSLRHSRDRFAVEVIGSIGMGIHDDFQGQGVSTPVMGAIVDLTFNWLGLRRIVVCIHRRLDPAVHLYEKFGFDFEGTGQNYAVRNGALVASYHLSRLHYGG